MSGEEHDVDVEVLGELDGDVVEAQVAKLSESYRDASARGFEFHPGRVPADYPIIEAFGYPPDADTAAANDARQRCWCPFMDQPCTKLIGPAETGICSIRYRAEGFGETTWAICQHRLKGAPFQEALIVISDPEPRRLR